MKLKKLLSIGLLMSGGLLTYAAETINVDGNPVTLEYSKAVQVGNLFNNGGNGNDIGSLSYNLNVTTPGEYLMYLSMGNKKPGSNHKFTITVTSDDEESTEYFNQEYGPFEACGGDWQSFIMQPIQITLNEGNVILKLDNKQNSSRWYLNRNIAPYVIPVGTKTQLGEEDAKIDIMHADPKSNSNFTQLRAFGKDTWFGENKSVLVTSQGTGKAEDNNYSNYPKTRLLYPVSINEEGTYPIELRGRFYASNPAGQKTCITNFTVNVNTVSENSNVTSDVVTGFAYLNDSNDESYATGSLHLEKGDFYLEISTDYEGTDIFLMTEMTIAGVSNEVLILVDQPEAYLNHSFVINGSVENCPENVTEVSIYHKDSESEEESLLGISEIEDGRFTYNVDDESIYSKGGEHVFIVKINDNDSEYSSEEIKIDLKLKTFVISSERTKGAKLQLGASGPLTDTNTSQSVTVNEGSTLVCTLTCDEGSYLADNSTLDGQKVTFEPTEIEDVFTYTFNDIKDDHHFVLNFATKQYTITYKVYGKGSIELQDNESKALRDNKPLHGNFVKAVITVDEETNQFSRIVVDGQEVKLDGENNESESDVEEGEDSENEVEEEISPVAESNALVYTLGAVKADHLIEVYMQYPEFEVNTIVDEGAVAHGSLSIALWEDEADTDESEEFEIMAINDIEDSETFPTSEVEHGTALAITATPEYKYALTKLEVTQNDETKIIYEHSRDAYSEPVTQKAFVEGPKMIVAATFGVITGIENVVDAKVSYHVSEAGITVNADEESIVTVSDIAGRLIFNGKVIGESFIPVNENGIITLQIKTANEIKVVKILK